LSSLVLDILLSFASWFFIYQLCRVSCQSEINFGYFPNSGLLTCFLVISQAIKCSSVYHRSRVCRCR
jgi:hypothetical protein